MPGLVSTPLDSLALTFPGTTFTLPSITVAGSNTHLLLFEGHPTLGTHPTTSVTRGTQTFRRIAYSSSGVIDAVGAWFLPFAEPGTEDIIVTFPSGPSSAQVGVSAITNPTGDPKDKFGMFHSQIWTFNSATPSNVVQTRKPNALAISACWVGGPDTAPISRSHTLEYTVGLGSRLDVQKVDPNLADPAEVTFSWTFPEANLLWGITLLLGVLPVSGGFYAASEFDLVKPKLVSR